MSTSVAPNEMGHARPDRKLTFISDGGHGRRTVRFGDREFPAIGAHELPKIQAVEFSYGGWIKFKYGSSISEGEAVATPCPCATTLAPFNASVN